MDNLVAPSGSSVPMVVEFDESGERSFDLYSKLLSHRIVFLGTAIDDAVANLVIAQLLHLEAEDPNTDIAVYINSPGGSVTSTLAVFDTMEFIKPDVSTVCTGQAAAGTAVVLAAGARGKRYALPHSTVSLQPLHGDIQGQSTDVEVAAGELERLRDLVDRILADKTCHTVDRIRSDTDRRFVMTADAAQEYGLVDDVLAARTASWPIGESES